MVQFNYLLPTVKQIEDLAQRLRQADAVLHARIDAQLSALTTDSQADYDAEIADARADSYGNLHNSLGENIRDGQSRVANELSISQDVLQAQINEVAEAILKQAIMLKEVKELLQNQN